eukprot:3137489-Amphidinium_carterae.2
MSLCFDFYGEAKYLILHLIFDLAVLRVCAAKGLSVLVCLRFFQELQTLITCQCPAHGCIVLIIRALQDYSGDSSLLDGLEHVGYLHASCLQPFWLRGRERWSSEECPAKSQELSC